MLENFSPTANKFYFRVDIIINHQKLRLGPACQLLCFFFSSSSLVSCGLIGIRIII